MRQGAEQERREEGAQGSDGGGLMTLGPYPERRADESAPAR